MKRTVLQKLRETQNLTIKGLAEKLGIAQYWIITHEHPRARYNRDGKRTYKHLNNEASRLLSAYFSMSISDLRKVAR